MNEHSVQITLKTSYNYGKDNQHTNIQGDVRTHRSLKVGDIVSFEELKPFSFGGDLSTDHYKFFEHRVYQCVEKPPRRPEQKWEANFHLIEQ